MSRAPDRFDRAAEGPYPDRRAFLSGLVSLPLIGGGVTLIGRPAAVIPLRQAAALPTFDGPRQRARYAWDAFSAAMSELTDGASGWRMVAGFEAPSERARGGHYMRLSAIELEADRLCSVLVLERTIPISI